MSDFFTDVKNWFKELAEWVQENLGDPYIIEAIRDDLGLAPDRDVPESQRDQIKHFADGLDPDKKGFAETVEDLKIIIEAFVQLGEQLTDDESTVTGWDVAYLLGKLLASELIRTREPIVYFVGKTTLFVTDDPEKLTELDPALLVRLGRGEPVAADYGEIVVQRISAGAALLIAVLEYILDKYVGPDLLDAYYGWDPAPDSTTPRSDLVSARTLSMIFSLPDVADVTPKIALTMTGVPPEHSGPGMFLSIGGSGAFEKTIDQTTLTIEAGAASALDMFIPFSGDAHDFELGSSAAGFLKFSMLHAGRDEPAFRIGDADKTRLDIGKIGLGVNLMSDRAGLRLFMKDAELVIKLGDGDGFLQQLPAGEIKLGFNFGILADTAGGFRVEGGTSVRATIPVEKSLGGVLNIHTIDLALGAGSAGYDAALEMSTTLGLTLGPFRASVDRIGFKFEFAFHEGNLGFMDVALGFKPPNGIGMVLDVGIVRGGGYLFLDHERGEYAGALELKIGAWGIKAIGLLTTKMPDGSEGWAFVLLIYADLPRFHIAFGIFFDGIGGMIGLHHSVDINALQEDLPNGALDDILFPANPVADAPRIINRLRVIFPIKRNAFTVGLMFRLSWGTPRVGEIKLGLILAFDNALGGDEDISLSKILLLGQLRIGMPETQRGDVVRIIVDFMGYLDFDNKRFGFYARLRNSRLVSVLELTGSLVLMIDYGDNPTFVVAAGGFHPGFKDLPDGLPSKLDRLGIKFKIASIVEVTINCYVAVTSATVQFGAEVKVKVDLDPVEISGYLGFDALIYYKPDFRFEVGFRAGMAIKVFGETLLGVDVEGTLYGPGHWRIKGSAKFKILFWSFNPKFDEEWGDKPAVPDVSTNVAALMAADYSNADNWSAALPAGSDTLVTLSALPGDTAVIAHPLGTLRVSQKTAPLGLMLDKYGETRIDGPNRFDLTSVTVGERTITEPVYTQEHLSRAQYLNLSDEQKLSEPSFENFDVGIAVGTEDYAVSPVVANGDLSYETKYLTPGEEGEDGILIHATLLHIYVTMDVLYAHAVMGAAAQSQLRLHDKLRGDVNKAVHVEQPPLTVVNQNDLGVVDGVAVNGRAASNTSLVEQAVKTSGVRKAQIVEAYELS
ncbi:MAG TPA: hypothetical protein PKD09_10260 [Aggregatilinea sp.]|uniref:DUF6603 domain-containing protein n=1 Tax=Aggregatilinea sp. TaxID=2806333 RepID=UPI002C10E987|nr:DUF6603 domain-containing protein [Aggregatilinea sp.]HML22024.1 hypothetical protein [Aggregatilinea sp.]